MKLLRKTNRIHLGVTAVLFMIAGFGLFFLFRDIRAREVDGKLLVNLDRVTERVKQGGSVPQLPPILEVNRSPGVQLAAPSVRDTVLYDPQEGELEHFREAFGVLYYRGEVFAIHVRQVLLDPYDLPGPVGLALAGVLLTLLLVLQAINDRMNARLWRPFHRSLAALGRFTVKDDAPLDLDDGNIDEFRTLNRSINELMTRVRGDYGALREFTANAAHEMQTPVAAVLNSLEQALQRPGIEARVAERIGEAHASAVRLSKLHQALLVLSRIENRQQGSATAVDLPALIDRHLDALQDLCTQRSISVTRPATGQAFVVHADPDLADLLLGNILGNAVKHNVDGGLIAVELTGRSLIVTNTGPVLDQPAARLFERFQKGDPSSRSLGLGLSIVRSICTAAGWPVDYTSEGDRHRIQVDF